MPTLTLRVTEAVTSPPTAIVYNDGQLTGGGTHATISAAIAAAGPGSIIELRNRTPGAATWAQTIVMNKSGVLGNPITLRVRDGDSVMLSTSGTLLNITGSNVIIKGNSTGRSGLRIGNPALWDAADKKTQWSSCYQHSVTLTASNCSNLTLQNMSLHGARSYEASVVQATVTQFFMRNCEVSKHGTNYSTIAGGSQGNDAGDLFRNNAKYSVLEDCDFRLGGHEVYSAGGPYEVHRRCTFDGDFTSANTGFPGTRCANADSGNQSNREPSTSWPGEWGPQLWEDCVLKNSGPSALNTTSQTYNPAAKMQGFRPIYRGNYFYDLGGCLFNGPGYSGIGTATGEVMSRGYVYHNTSYNTAGVWNNLGNLVAANAANYTDDQREYRFVNNIFAALDNGKANKNTGLNVIVWNAINIPIGSYPNSWKGTVWRDNVFNGPATLMNFSLTNATNGGTVPVNKNPGDAGFPASWTPNVYGNSLASTINFANPAARTKAGFAITSGPGYQDAAPLTTTTSAGSGKSLPVADAGYFYDGWGITGETGDYIKVGSNAPVKVTAVNWTTNTLTLATAISWANGDTVYFAGNDGAANAGTVFDNKGAAQ